MFDLKNSSPYKGFSVADSIAGALTPNTDKYGLNQLDIFGNGGNQSGLDVSQFLDDTDIASLLGSYGNKDNSNEFIPSVWDRITGYTDPNTKIEHGSLGALGLGALKGIGSGLLGMKMYGIAKDELEESKRQFNTNFAAQQKLTNASLEDRQRARVASNPGAYQSVSSYMDKNRI